MENKVSQRGIATFGIAALFVLFGGAVVGVTVDQCAKDGVESKKECLVQTWENRVPDYSGLND